MQKATLKVLGLCLVSSIVLIAGCGSSEPEPEIKLEPADSPHKMTSPSGAGGAPAPQTAPTATPGTQ